MIGCEQNVGRSQRKPAEEVDGETQAFVAVTIVGVHSGQRPGTVEPGIPADRRRTGLAWPGACSLIQFDVHLSSQ